MLRLGRERHGGRVQRDAAGRAADDARTTNLPGHGAAGRYARLIIRDLKERAGYRDPQLKMIVTDADGAVIHTIPF